MGSPWQPDDPDPHGECAVEIVRLGEIAKDARMLATAVLDAKVGCMPPEEMRTIAVRIISANPF